MISQGLRRSINRANFNSWHGERLFQLFSKRIYSNRYVELSGWDKPPIWRPTCGLPVRIEGESLSRYHFQKELQNATTERVLREVVKAVAERDGVPIGPENIHLVSGGTEALTLVLHYAKQQGIHAIVADPPFYFSVRYLCDFLGLELLPVPKSPETIWDLEQLPSLLSDLSEVPKMVLLTQPRYVLSRNYPRGYISDISRCLSAEDLVLLDQANDCEWLNRTEPLQCDERVIRIRSFAKLAGLYGSRLAAVVSGPETVESLNAISQWLFGALDAGLLELGYTILSKRRALHARLNAVRQIVDERYRLAASTLMKLRTPVVKPENGVLGYALVPINTGGRYKLYARLLDRHVNVLFGSQVGLLNSDGVELVRINFLLDVEEGIRALRSSILSHCREV